MSVLSTRVGLYPQNSFTITLGNSIANHHSSLSAHETENQIHMCIILKLACTIFYWMLKLSIVESTLPKMILKSGFEKCNIRKLRYGNIRVWLIIFR